MMTSALALVICCSKSSLHQATFTERQLRWGSPFSERYQGIQISKGKRDSLLAPGIQECCRITVLRQICYLNTHKKLNFQKWFE